LLDAIFFALAEDSESE